MPGLAYVPVIEMDAPILIGAWAAAGSATAITIAATEPTAAVFQDDIVMADLLRKFGAGSVASELPFFLAGLRTGVKNQCPLPTRRIRRPATVPDAISCQDGSAPACSAVHRSARMSRSEEHTSEF